MANGSTRMNGGFVSIQPQHSPIANVNITDAGRKAATDGPYAHNVKNNCDSSQYTFRLTTLDKIEVTGIRQEGTTAKVEYRVCRTLTPVGKAVRDLHPSEHEMGSVPA
jgi:hypothetical protein